MPPKSLPLNIHVWKCPDSVPLLCDSFNRALDGGSSAWKTVVVLLNALHLSKMNNVYYRPGIGNGPFFQPLSAFQQSSQVSDASMSWPIIDNQLTSSSLDERSFSNCLCSITSCSKRSRSRGMAARHRWMRSFSIWSRYSLRLLLCSTRAWPGFGSGGGVKGVTERTVFEPSQFGNNSK